MSTHSDERIYFYCCPPIDVAERAFFQHVLICLAEGFKQLGIEFYSNVNYWQTSPDGEDYLLRHDPKIKPEDCSIVCIHIQDTIERIERNPELLENIAVQGRAWALKYYSPVPTALRFLETVNQVRCFSQKHLKEGQTP